MSRPEASAVGGLRKRPVGAAFVKQLDHLRLDRGMRLIDFESRCVIRHEIHEIVTTDQRRARPGERVDRVGFLGFVEVLAGGVIERGDRALLAGRPLGAVLGFDVSHFPNHLNILIATGELLTASTAGVELETELRFEGPRP